MRVDLVVSARGRRGKRAQRYTPGDFLPTNWGGGDFQRYFVSASDKDKGKVHLGLYSAASRLSHLSGAVRHRQGRCSAYRPRLYREFGSQPYSCMQP